MIHHTLEQCTLKKINSPQSLLYTKDCEQKVKLYKLLSSYLFLVVNNGEIERIGYNIYRLLVFLQ